MSPSLYPITPTKDNTFEFITDSGHTYTVYFDRSASVFNDVRVDRYAYYFGFSCYPAQKVFNRVHDKKIGLTLMHIIAAFFKAYPDSILAYVCSALDQQDRHRQVLFMRWYNSSPLKEDFIFISKKIFDTYCGAIYSIHHPAMKDISDAFFDFDLSSKPEVWEEEGLYFPDEEE